MSFQSGPSPNSQTTLNFPVTGLSDSATVGNNIGDDNTELSYDSYDSTIIDVPVTTSTSLTFTNVARLIVTDGVPKYLVPKEEKDNEVTYDFTCPICSLDDKPLTIAICGHSICEECTEGLTDLVCPICRASFYRWMLVENKYITEKDIEDKKDDSPTQTDDKSVKSTQLMIKII